MRVLAQRVGKDAHLRDRAHAATQRDSPLHASLTRRRAEPSQRYIEGMRELMRALFANGHTVADACMEEAYARAMAISIHVRETENGVQDH
jgi:hypothetical protein